MDLAEKVFLYLYFKLIVKNYFNIFIKILRKHFECLSSYVNEVEKSIKFYEIYHQSNDTLPIFLLCGPTGCGKSRIVESVCSNLDLHLCKVSFLTKQFFFRLECEIKTEFKDKWCKFSWRISIGR